jgi:hypothetical protein
MPLGLKTRDVFHLHNIADVPSVGLGSHRVDLDGTDYSTAGGSEGAAEQPGSGEQVDYRRTAVNHIPVSQVAAQ